MPRTTENASRVGPAIGSRVVRLAILGLAILPAGCSGVLNPAGPIASAERTILLTSLVIMLAIVVPTLLATVAFAWWFRAGNTKARRRPDWTYSGKVELVVWSIPFLVILFLGGITYVGAHKLDPYRPLDGKVTPLEIEVVSLDWKWLFIYPDRKVAALNELVVPAGVPLNFHITSATVMTAFFIPQLGSMIYSMNGMETQLHLMADDPGTFRGLASHYSGAGFADMNFPVRAVPMADFDAWVAKVAAGGRPLDEAAYKGLLKASIKDAPVTYGSVEDGLFRRIVTRTAPDAPEREPGDTGSVKTSGRN